MIYFGTNAHKTTESCWWPLLVTLQWTNTSLVISKLGTFSLILSLVIILLILPNNFVVSCVQISR